MNIQPILIFDDREFTGSEVSNLVGVRRFGDIVIRQNSLFDQFQAALPPWARDRLIRLRNEDDLIKFYATIEASSEDTAICIIAGCAGFEQAGDLTQFLRLLPFAEENFTSSLYKPLVVFLRNIHSLIEKWASFKDAPMHKWVAPWEDSDRLTSIRPLNLDNLQDFLLFISGSTATRYFNDVNIGPYYYTKRSRDKRKIQAEYLFYSLAPEKMRPWLIQPFDYCDEGDSASYSVMRYFLADAALQWIHGALDDKSFTPFIERLLFFLGERPKKVCDDKDSLAKSYDLFVGKLENRLSMLLASEEGLRINRLVLAANSNLEIMNLFKRFLGLYKKFENGFKLPYLTVGHGDPCFSNILYDQQHYLLKLIDPKGALVEGDLWTHPLYDLCKISHSILGDYDFINNGLYSLGLSGTNDLVLNINNHSHYNQKQIFIKSVESLGIDIHIMRLGEVSLFLSMLPLHIDHPSKVIAFILKANEILDEVEVGY